MSFELKKEKFKKYIQEVIYYISHIPGLKLKSVYREPSDWVINEEDYLAKFLINREVNPIKIKEEILKMKFEFDQQGRRISDIDVYYRPYKKERGILNNELIDWCRYNLFCIGNSPIFQYNKISKKDLTF